jgi:chaperone modulatory protein CbpM
MQAPEWNWLDPSETLGLDELARLCGMAAEDLRELADDGVLVSVEMRTAGEPRFGADCVGPLRQAVRLRVDFDLDLFTTGLLFGHLRRIDALERQVASLRARLPGSRHQGHDDDPTPEPHEHPR